MSWVTPAPKSAGDFVSTTDWNQNTVANILELKDPPSGNFQLDESANYTTTSSVFVDIDVAKLGVTLTTNGGDLMVTFVGCIVNSANGRTYLNLTLDGVAVAGDDGINGLFVGATVLSGPISFTYWITGVSAGSHTVRLQWKQAGGVTSTLYAGAGTATADVHAQFAVREVS